MNITKKIGEIFAPLVDLIYPPRCPLCGDALGQQGGLCLECWQEIRIPDEAVNGIVAATIYNDASRKLILAFKHGGKIALAPMLARLIAARIDTPSKNEELPLLVPVPLHPLRLWSRGYNQSALLARGLSRLGKGHLMVDALKRTKSTPTLGGLNKLQRMNALSQAIAVRRQRLSRIKGRDIILVDDVLTTGATSNACAKALLDAGANSVTIACFAKVQQGAQ